MKYLIILLISPILAIAQVLSEEPFAKLNKKYCEQGVVEACQLDKCLDDLETCDEGLKNSLGAQNGLYKYMGADLQKCGTDQNCIDEIFKRVKLEMTKKLITECQKGNKTSCYFKELEDQKSALLAPKIPVKAE